MTRLTTEAEKITRTTLKLIEFDRDQAAAWPLAKCQRPPSDNKKVHQVSLEIAADGGVIPGVVTFAQLGRDVFLLDGQQRRNAFLMSGCEVGYADTRLLHVREEADMDKEFVKLNSYISRFRPDSVLKGLESSAPSMAKVRQACPFVGYEYIRRNESSPILSMSGLLRSWKQSIPEVPTTSTAAAHILAEELTDDEAKHLIEFTKLAYASWGPDKAYARLWANLNMAICMWLYRRLVLLAPAGRATRLDRPLFGKCLMSLSAEGNYVDWLSGRNLTDPHRSPAYFRIKKAFVARIAEETGKKVSLPQPEWAGR